MPKIKREQVIEMNVSDYVLSELLMEWLQENTLMDSPYHYEYFLEEGSIYKGENGSYTRDEAEFITNDERIVSIFEAACNILELS